MKRWLIRAHRWIETLPERWYPFWYEVEGLKVRGIRAYEQMLTAAKRLHGPSAFGYQLLVYRGVWHIIGALLLALVCTIVAYHIFGSQLALIVLLSTLVVGICLQELILHPRRYGQTLQKSLFDIVTWVMPILMYAWLVV